MSNSTLSWSFLVSYTESESEMFSETQPNHGSQKYKSYFTWQVENKLFKASVFMNEWQPNSPGCEDRSEWQCHKTRLQWLTDVAFHSTHQKGYQSKLLFFHLKGSRFSSWGLTEAMTEDRHDEPAARDLSLIAVALTPSWLVWILTVMPDYIFHHSCFFSVLFWNTKLYILYKCKLNLIFITVRKLAI